MARSTTALHVFVVLVVAISMLAIPVLSRVVIGIDLGSDSYKIMRKSRAIEIVLNEQTQRKSPTVVAFSGESKERVFMDKATNLVGPSNKNNNNT
jgi:molecular chaperone DnaK (HSP70)